MPSVMDGMYMSVCVTKSKIGRFPVGQAFSPILVQKTSVV